MDWCPQQLLQQPCLGVLMGEGGVSTDKPSSKKEGKKRQILLLEEAATMPGLKYLFKQL
jgi:hypothetical protein